VCFYTSLVRSRRSVHCSMRTKLAWVVFVCLFVFVSVCVHSHFFLLFYLSRIDCTIFSNLKFKHRYLRIKYSGLGSLFFAFFSIGP
jgi:hypothetical protein